MKGLRRLGFLVLASGMALAQANTPSSPTVADELKALREAIAAQQQQIQQQQQQIQDLKQSLADKNSGAAHVADAALVTTATAPVTVANMPQADAEKAKESPLSFRIGGAQFTPGGFVDFTNVFRSTNTGNVVATSFWAIPFSNTVAGHLTEYRSTGQYSRVSLKANTKFHNTDVTGYVEADFNGNDAANVFITSNGHTMRMRVYYVDLRNGKWEILGGSPWGLQTPNRVGISANPADLSLTFGADAQTHVGINYTRAGEFRVGYHFTDKFVWAVALQNPQQSIGQGNEVIFPAAFNAQLGTQVDNAATPGTPNFMPDFITKMAYDTTFGARKFHLELGGLTTSAKVAVLPTLVGATFDKQTKFGAGGFAGIQAEIVKNLRFVGQGMWGPGVGRYIIDMGPQSAMIPIPAVSGGTCAAGATGGCTVRPSMIRAGDALVGVEALPTPKTQLGFYYGGAYFQRNAFQDLTVAAHPIIGFGGAGSANINNRAIQEGTIDWTQTFWKNPQYGAVLLVTQASYVTRAPWFVPAGAPKNAHLGMGYVSLRYVLP